MKLKDITDVLTFRAFRPEPDDSTAPWRKRFPKEKTLMLNVGRRRTTWAVLDRQGEFGEVGSMDGEFKDVIAQQGNEWRAMTDNGWCAVSINTRMVVSLEVNLSRRPGLEEQLRTNPKAALGAKAERSKRYSLTHNPESNSSVLLSCDEEVITKTESAMKEAGLSAGRVACGAYGMLLELISQVQEARASRPAGQPFGNAVLVTCCDGSVCALTVKEESWTELRSRTDLYTDDLSPVLEIILPLVQNAGGNTQVIFMGDNAGLNFTELMNARAPGLPVSDVTVPNQLWKLLADL